MSTMLIMLTTGIKMKLSVVILEILNGLKVLLQCGKLEVKFQNT